MNLWQCAFSRVEEDPERNTLLLYLKVENGGTFGWNETVCDSIIIIAIIYKQNQTKQPSMQVLVVAESGVVEKSLLDD